MAAPTPCPNPHLSAAPSQIFSFPQHFGVGSIPWSPLARGALTRPLGERSIRADNDLCAVSLGIDVEGSPVLSYLHMLAGTANTSKSPAIKKLSDGERSSLPPPLFGFSPN
jgi:aryl-alcohol dehydrogenase-like predicted oxidoreductase